MQRPYGFLPSAFTAYILACYKAGIDPNRVVQCIGNAPASAGYHARDGIVLDNGVPRAYCAATDVSVRGLSDAQIHELVEQLSRQGFAAWYRYRGSFANNRHIHFVFAGCKMKSQLRGQVHDFLAGRDGLAGHQWEEYFTPTTQMDDYIRAQFLKYNPANG